MEATVKSKKGKKSSSTKKRASPTGKAQTQSQPQSFQEDEMMPDESRYVGCFASESSFIGSSLIPFLPSPPTPSFLPCFPSTHTTTYKQHNQHFPPQIASMTVDPQEPIMD